MRNEAKRAVRVGILMVVATAVLVLTVFAVGNRRQLFIHHHEYHTTFRHVTGLEGGAPVLLNGVTVGFVKSIQLPETPEKQRIRVEFSVDSRYEDLIRDDTIVTIRSLGLLGDKYLEVRGGSADAEVVPPGGRVTGRDPAELTEFVSSGEDLVENLLAISSSLKVILRRVEAGEGVLGDLTKDPENGESLGRRVDAAMDSLSSILARIERGEGLAGRLISDEATADHVMASLESTGRAVERVAAALAADLRRQDTAYATLFRDPAAASLLRDSLDSLRRTSDAAAAALEELAGGTGTLPRLMGDEAYADEFLADLARLVDHLRSVAAKLDRGAGTAGALVNDPQIYEDLENIVRGVEDSKVITWFARNRRKKGEKISAQCRQEAILAVAELLEEMEAEIQQTNEPPTDDPDSDLE